jgi:hypothetical protein
LRLGGNRIFEPTDAEANGDRENERTDAAIVGLLALDRVNAVAERLVLVLQLLRQARKNEGLRSTPSLLRAYLAFGSTE